MRDVQAKLESALARRRAVRRRLLGVGIAVLASVGVARGRRPSHDNGQRHRARMGGGGARHAGRATVAGAAHAVHAQQAARFNALVVAFLEQHRE